MSCRCNSQQGPLVLECGQERSLPVRSTVARVTATRLRFRPVPIDTPANLAYSSVLEIVAVDHVPTVIRLVYVYPYRLRGGKWSAGEPWVNGPGAIARHSFRRLLYLRVGGGHRIRQDPWRAGIIHTWPTPCIEEHTTDVIQRYLDELAGGFARRADCPRAFGAGRPPAARAVRQFAVPKLSAFDKAATESQDRGNARRRGGRVAQVHAVNPFTDRTPVLCAGRTETRTRSVCSRP